ncbi:MAG TPA: hypothetical protein VIJ62_01520 [Rhizomicrobium sp.]
MSILSSCSTNKAISERELDEQAKDHSAVSGALPSDAVRDRATAIAIAENLCRAETVPKNRHWRATLDGNLWIVDQIIPGAYPDDDIDGAYIKIRKQDGTAYLPCKMLITVY